MEIARRKDPLFLIGLPMSGASWLGAILDAHPRLAVVRDSPWIAGGEGINTPFKAVFETLIHDRRGPVKNFDGIEEDHVAAALAQAVSDLLDAHAVALGKARWIDATPRHIGEIPYLARLFPSGRFIHIVRDGRDVACAVCRDSDGSGDHFWTADGAEGHKTHLNALRRWCDWIDQLDRWSEELRLNVLTVPFERLRENPDEELRKILDYMGERWDARLADRSRRMEIASQESLPKELGRWRRQFPPHELAEAASFSFAALSRCGYEPVEPRVCISAPAVQVRIPSLGEEDAKDMRIHVCGILHKDAPPSSLWEALQHVDKEEFVVEMRWVEPGDAAASSTDPDLHERLKQLIGLGGMTGYDLSELSAEVDVLRRWMKGGVDIVHYLDGERSVRYLPMALHRLHGLRPRPALIATFCQAPAALREKLDHRVLGFLDHVIVESRELEDHFRRDLLPEKVTLVQQEEGSGREKAAMQLERVYRLLAPQKTGGESPNFEADSGSATGEPQPDRSMPSPGCKADESLQADICRICGSQETTPLYEGREWKVRYLSRPVHYVGCNRCGSILLFPATDAAEIGAYYRNIYRYADYRLMKKVKFYQAMDRLDKIRNFLGRPVAHGLLLDVGANFGHFLHAAQFEGWSVEGIEISEKAIQAAEEEYGLKIHRGQLEEVEYPSGSFEAVTMWHVLEHSQDPKQAVQKAGKWLKPGGILGVAIPNVKSLASRICGWRWRWLSPPVHQNHLSKRALVELCEDNGLEPVKSYTRDNFGSKDVLYEYLSACVLSTHRWRSKAGAWLVRQIVGDERSKNDLLFPWAWRLKSGTYLEWHAGHLLEAEPLRRLRSWTRLITLAMHPLMRLLWTFGLGAELEMYFRKSAGERPSGEERGKVVQINR